MRTILFLLSRLAETGFINPLCKFSGLQKKNIFITQKLIITFQIIYLYKHLFKYLKNHVAFFQNQKSNTNN